MTLTGRALYLSATMKLGTKYSLHFLVSSSVKEKEEEYLRLRIIVSPYTKLRMVSTIAL